MRVQLKRIFLNFHQLGSGRPILFLHGQRGDHRQYLDLMEPLFEKRDGWHRIYLDLPGHGESDGPDWVENQDQILDILLEFIDRLIPQQDFVIAGSSYGCYLARGIIYQRPSQVDGLLMIVPVILADRSRRDLPSHRTLDANPALLESLSDEQRHLVENFFVLQSEMALEKFGRLLGPAQALYNADFMNRIEANRAFSFDVDQMEAPFDKPTLMLMGRQDAIVGYRDAWNILENFPRATFTVLDKAGHFLSMSEQISLSASLISEWLDRVETEI